ncbi:hypothetical protein D3C76_1005040 [compost metagenome]
MVRAAAQDGDRADHCRVRRQHPAVPLRAAAVLPGFRAPGADGRPEAGRRRVVVQYRRAGQTTGGAAQAAGGHRQLCGLCGYRVAALLPAAGPAVAGRQLCPVRRAGQIDGRARTAAQLADRYRRPAVPRLARPRHAPGKRPTRGLPGAVPGDRRAYREGARPGPRSGRQGAREPARGKRAPGLGGAKQGGVPGHRSGPRPRPWREHRAPVELLAQLADRHHGQPVPRGQRTDRDPAARHAERAWRPG